MAMMSGKFTIQDMYNQFEAMQNMGPTPESTRNDPRNELPATQREMEGEKADWKSSKYIIQSP